VLQRYDTVVLPVLTGMCEDFSHNFFLEKSTRLVYLTKFNESELLASLYVAERQLSYDN
jgi:hypothetical protein